MRHRSRCSDLVAASNEDLLTNLSLEPKHNIKDLPIISLSGHINALALRDRPMDEKTLLIQLRCSARRSPALSRPPLTLPVTPPDTFRQSDTLPLPIDWSIYLLLYNISGRHHGGIMFALLINGNQGAGANFSC